jgi:hypothetical protein
MLDDDEEFFQFDRNLNDGREHNHKRSLVFPSDKLRYRRLNDFRVRQELVKIVEQQKCTATALGQAGQGTQCR